MGGRRVWGAWMVFVLAALPSLLDVCRDRLPAMVDPAAAPTPVRSGGVPASYRAAPLRFLSRAPADSLRRLPGIGPVLAARIVEARSGQGPFDSWEELRVRIRGIGGKSIARLRHAAEAVADPIGARVDGAVR